MRARAGPAALSRSRAGKPLREVPVALCVADDIQAGLREQKAAQLEMPSQKTSPARPNAKRFGPEEILLAETGVFADRDGLRFQGRPAPDADFIAADFDGPAERRREPGRQFLLKNSMVNQQGNSRVSCPQQNHEQQKPLDRPFPKAAFRGAAGVHVSRSDSCGGCVDDKGQGWFSQFKCLPACKRMRDGYRLQDERRSVGREWTPLSLARN